MATRSLITFEELGVRPRESLRKPEKTAEAGLFPLKDDTPRRVQDLERDRDTLV
jgi:hypothetical protein